MADTPSTVARSGPGQTLRKYATPLFFLVIALLVPKVIQPIIGDRWLPMTTVVLCAIYVLFAIGLNVVVGYAGLLDLGYVAFFLFGAYTAGWFMSDFFASVDDANGKCVSDALRCWLTDVSGSDGIHVSDAGIGTVPGIHLSFWFVIFLAGFIAAISGVVIGAPTLRLKSDYLALVTLGFGEILPQLFRNGESMKGFNLSNGTKGIGPLDALDMGWLAWIPGVPDKINVFDYSTRYYVIIGLGIVFIFVSLRLREGRLGRAWIAIREDELAASLMGVPLWTTKLWSYAIGAIAGGVAGAFYAVSLGGVQVDPFNFQFSVLILIMVIVGGMGNVYGVALGAILLQYANQTGLKELGNQFNSWFGTSISVPKYQFILFGLLLVLMMLFRREGILPESRARQARLIDEKIEQAGTEEALAAGAGAAS